MYQLYNTLPDQLDGVARCHIASFPASLSSKLGFAYAKKSLEWFLAGDNRFLFHIADNGTVIGYCGGFRSMGEGDGSTSGMMQFAMKEAAAGMFKKPWLFFDKDVIRFYPLILKNIRKKIVAGTNTKEITEAGASPSHIGLVVIGVHPDYRGKGCFEMLMNQFESECIKRGIAKMTLSVKASNARAIAAYKKVGWLTGKETNGASEMFKTLG